MVLAAPQVMIMPDNAPLVTASLSSARDLVVEEDSDIRLPEPMDELYQQVGSLYLMLREEIISLTLSELLVSSFIPWTTLIEEFETYFRVFASNKCFQALKAHLQESREKHGFVISIYAQKQITSLGNGVIPFEWMELAFTHTVGPSTTISIPQLVLLVTCRLVMLINYLCGEQLAAINLAVLSDARSFLRAMKAFCAKQWSQPVDNVVLVLENEPQHDSQVDDIAGSETSSAQQRQPKGSEPATDSFGALNPAMIRDARDFACSFIVDGLVVIEQCDTSAKSNQTNLYPLPLCRLYCAIKSDLLELERQETEIAQFKSADGSNTLDEKFSADQDAASNATRSVPFVMLPSLSPYQQPPDLFDHSTDEHTNAVILDTGVRLRFPLEAVISALNASRYDQRETAFAIGAPMFSDDDDVQVG